MQKNKTNNKKTLELAGIGALVAAAAGAYFLYGSKNAKANRKKVSSWMLKAKADVMDKLENASHVSEDTFKGIVDTVMQRYKSLKQVDPKELAALAAELKGHWRNIKQDIEKRSKLAVSKKPQSKKKTVQKKKSK